MSEIDRTSIAVILFAALEHLRKMAMEHAALGDASGQDVINTLTMAWAAAVRWRIEQSGDFIHDEEPAPTHPS
ncbi:MAG: hypothetical protein WDM79_02440 [Terricaulis sp.]